jgi:hypothetical protein
LLLLLLCEKRQAIGRSLRWETTFWLGYDSKQIERIESTSRTRKTSRQNSKVSQYRISLTTLFELTEVEFETGCFCFCFCFCFEVINHKVVNVRKGTQQVEVVMKQKDTETKTETENEKATEIVIEEIEGVYILSNSTLIVIHFFFTCFVSFLLNRDRDRERNRERDWDRDREDRTRYEFLCYCSKDF